MPTKLAIHCHIITCQLKATYLLTSLMHIAIDDWLNRAWWMWRRDTVWLYSDVVSQLYFTSSSLWRTPWLSRRWGWECNSLCQPSRTQLVAIHCCLNTVMSIYADCWDSLLVRRGIIQTAWGLRIGLWLGLVIRLGIKINCIFGYAEPGQIWASAPFGLGTSHLDC